MPRPLRLDPGDLCYHVINRGNGRARVFRKPDDFAAFERILSLGCELVDMRVLAWCLMPDHFPVQTSLTFSPAIRKVARQFFAF